MRNSTNYKIFGEVDWLTVGIWLLLCLVGWFNIYAAVYDPEQPEVFNFATNYGKQSVFILTALILGLTILVIEAKFFGSAAPFIYGFTLVLLVLVLIIGRNVGGNQAWIPIGSFRLQPSEFAKVATCLLLAQYLNTHSIKPPNYSTFFNAAMIVIAPVILVILQPDAGSALAFTSLVFVFYREGYVSTQFLILVGAAIFLFVIALVVDTWVILLSLAFIAAICIYLNRKRRNAIRNIIVFFIISCVYIPIVDFAFNNILRPHQRSRIEVILGKIDDPRGESYNLNQSKIAIGSGQLFGKGYLQGTQTKYNFVPEQSTDFIFCTVGEEWGFVGSLVVISIYLFLLMRLIIIAERQRSPFARIYGYGVASILFFHFAINIGMTIGLVPVIGIPLPFISYGGSSLWSFSILLFILLKFDSNRKGVV